MSSEKLSATLVLSSEIPCSIEVVNFQGHESTTSPYHIKIIAYCDRQNIDVSCLLNVSACFTVTYLGQKKKRYGVITDASTIGESFSNGSTLVTFILEPRVALLARNHRYRIFNYQSVLEVITSVLADNVNIIPTNGYQLNIIDQENDQTMALHQKLIYCVQYDENDLAFIIRLMSEWGLGFYFEQDEQAKLERFVIINGAPDLSLLYPRPFHNIPYEYRGKYRCAPIISRYRWHVATSPILAHFKNYQRLRPTSLSDAQMDHDSSQQNSHDFTGYRIKLDCQQKPHPYDLLSRYSFLPKDVGEYLCSVADASYTASSKLVNVKSNHVGLGSSMVISLDSVDPTDSIDPFLLLTQVSFEGQLKTTRSLKNVNIRNRSYYQCYIESVPPASLVYRLPQYDVIPRIDSCTATILGNEKGEIDMDNQRRIKVKFNWTSLHSKDKSDVSAYLYIAQPYGLDEYFDGSELLNVGDEVVVGFISGSPSHPIIEGPVDYVEKRFAQLNEMK